MIVLDGTSKVALMVIRYEPAIPVLIVEVVAGFSFTTNSVGKGMHHSLFPIPC